MTVRNMGTNPYREKMPNQGMGREMSSSRQEREDEKPQDVNVQEIGTDPQIPGPSPSGLGTNFTHGRKTKRNTEKE